MSYGIDVSGIPQSKLLFEMYKAAGGTEKTEEDAKKECEEKGGKIGIFGGITIEADLSRGLIDGKSYDQHAGNGVTLSGVVDKLREVFEKESYKVSRKKVTNSGFHSEGKEQCRLQ